MDNPLIFIKRAINSPLSVGSITPSSRFLSEAITSDLKKSDVIVELGSGTGVITKSIINKVGYKNLLSIELDQHFVDYVKGFDDNINIKQGDAENINDITKNTIFSEVDIIISSLAFRNIDDQKSIKILKSCYEILKKDGVIIQYTYGNTPPFSNSVLKYSGFEVLSYDEKIIWLNIPPARIFKLKKIY